MNGQHFASLDHVDDNTPMGGNLLGTGEGATFRVWAPSAREVWVRWDYQKTEQGDWKNNATAALQQKGGGFWVGFVPGLTASESYMYYVVGPDGGMEGLKRDPYARDLTDDPMWPNCHCLLIDPRSFPWHDQDFRPPPFHELIIYQLHIGVWYFPANRNNGTFFEIIAKLPYLKNLGINAIQPLPIEEFSGTFSLGYNGVDYFSPETDYGVRDTDAALQTYLASINTQLLAINPGFSPYRLEDIQGTANQLKVMVDMCHLYNIAVLLDVVYNHAGGDFSGGESIANDRSIFFFDCKSRGNLNDSLYFTDRGWAGGLVFAYWKDNVKQFLIDNATYFLTEYHCDGFRYDEVSVIKNVGGYHGWLFCKYVTETCKYIKPEAIHIAECWPVESAIVKPASQNGAGFDAIQNDGLRDAVRSAIGQSAQGASAFVDMERIGREIASPILNDRWRAVQCTENHDLVRHDRGWRIPKIADSSNSRSWYARSRSRVAMGLTLTAAGIPHIFMGQEMLEDKQWSDNPQHPFLIWWEGLDQGDKAMVDFLQFTREVIAVRRSQKGLRGDGINVYHASNDNRILAFHRWVPREGYDVVVVASLNESTFNSYELGFPINGYWKEVINSDVYDNWANPWGTGNGGEIYVSGGGMHGLHFSTSITIPANSILIFSK
ncbi:alpha-amylase family glycosyl hydrolase [Desulforhopalus sp. IMCC35007]|uniref:alpha-amylase family glycosyl hydrolase n=1 Tax=Desulforhopalus sp. IMCC35007 TaxID=2569543 RepID=UPI0010ADBCC3|nr:alpha-amylase family glycosyl hydrolase [Desulforhopalus sp. IMCC35007]TKB06378.1 1,4-alpha-glucan branching protein [Desulforhopalus sp. IMCC35007]